MNRQLPIRSLLFAVALAFVSQSVFAQQMRISGRVCDSSGPVIGAVAVVKGTMRGISTDFDGQYVIDVAPGETLVFSYVGLQSVEVPIDATTKSPLNITLQETSTVLSDVVVVGYGKQTKQSVTGAISQVKGDELMKAGGVTNVSSALTGLVPGLVTLNYSGKPGQDDAEIFIRTVSTWNDASPLVLIDGIERGMNDIDLGEVENISVLKDASATAVFGVRGGNGVILITTKRGKEGSPTFSASANVTLKMSSKLPKNADSYTGLWYRNQAIENQVSMNGDLWSEYTPTEILRRYRDGDNPYLYPNVDWQSEMLRKHSWSQRYALDVRGGTKFVKYYGSLAYVYDGDVLKGQDFGQGYVPKNDYKRFNFRTNLDFQPTATTTISVDIDGAWGIERTTTATPAYLWPGIYSKGPDQYPVRYEDGTFANNESGYAMYNPVEYFNFSGLERHTRMDINTSFTLNQKLDFVTKGLSFRAMANFQNYYWSIGPNITASRPITKYIDWKTGEETINYPSDYTNSKYGFDYVLGKYTLSTENIWSSGGSPKMSKNLMYQAQFNYNRTFGLHKVSGLILFKRIENAAGSAFPSYREEWAGRATYDFDNRYLFEFNAAYNGSEKFAKGNKFGFFPSAAVGWILSEEPFFRRSELKRFVDLFKFRYSWGKVGSDSGINRWLYMTQWSKATSTAWLGSPSASRPEYSGFHITNIGNPDAKWETAVKNDFAVEASFFKNTLSLTFDYYWVDTQGVAGRNQARSKYGAKRPTAKLEEQRMHDAQVPMLIDALVRCRSRGRQYRQDEGARLGARNALQQLDQVRPQILRDGDVLARKGRDRLHGGSRVHAGIPEEGRLPDRPADLLSPQRRNHLVGPDVYGGSGREYVGEQRRYAPADRLQRRRRDRYERHRSLRLSQPSAVYDEFHRRRGVEGHQSLGAALRYTQLYAGQKRGRILVAALLYRTRHEHHGRHVASGVAGGRNLSSSRVQGLRRERPFGQLQHGRRHAVAYQERRTGLHPHGGAAAQGGNHLAAVLHIGQQPLALLAPERRP